MTGFRLSISHLSWYDKPSTSSFVIVFPCILPMIWNSSGHLRSAHDSVINHVGMPSCFTIPRTSYINFCQYGGLPRICCKNRYACSWQIRFRNMSEFDFNCDAVTGWPRTFFRAILILSDIFLCSIINCAKKRYSGLLANLPL